MLRFTAPENVTGAFLTSGNPQVEDGVLSIPDDAPQSDISGLVANGFRPILEDSAPATPVPAKASPSPAPAPKGEE